MSHECDGTYDIYDETPRTARKAHKCDACEETIPVGERYFRVFTLYDGKKSSIKRCRRCQAIHQHLRKLCAKNPSDQLWPDEELNCGEDYKDVWGEDPPEEIAALAFALPGETTIEKV